MVPTHILTTTIYSIHRIHRPDNTPVDTPPLIYAVYLLNIKRIHDR